MITSRQKNQDKKRKKKKYVCKTSFLLKLFDFESRKTKWFSFNIVGSLHCRMGRRLCVSTHSYLRVFVKPHDI